MPDLPNELRTKFEPSRQYAIVHPGTKNVLTHKHNVAATFTPWAEHDTQIFGGSSITSSDSDESYSKSSEGGVIIKAAAAPRDGLGFLGHGKIGFKSARPGVWLDIKQPEDRRGDQHDVAIFLCDDSVSIQLGVSPAMELVEYSGSQDYRFQLCELPVGN